MIAASMASSQMDNLTAALNRGLEAGPPINEPKKIPVQPFAHTGFPLRLNPLIDLIQLPISRNNHGRKHIEGKQP